MLRMYDFKCKRCGKVFEEFVELENFDDTPTATCSCGWEAKKIIGKTNWQQGRVAKDSGRNKWI